MTLANFFQDVQAVPHLCTFFQRCPVLQRGMVISKLWVRPRAIQGVYAKLLVLSRWMRWMKHSEKLSSCPSRPPQQVSWFSSPPGSRYGPAAYFPMRTDGFQSRKKNMEHDLCQKLDWYKQHAYKNIAECFTCPQAIMC